jgi:predicted ATPase/class 3 adenylate cyclase
MPERPSGVVTFLFTDIEGSTRMLRALGPERYGQALDEHRRLLRDAFGRYGGHEEGTEGDSFMVAFARPADALAAAATAQAALATHDWHDGERVHVRAGIHTGEALARESGYVGVAVHRAARIAAAGHGDQVVVSQTTVDLVRDLTLPYRLVDLGQHRLKDLTEPQHLYQLESSTSGPVSQFPPLRTARDRPTNLPPQPAALIGREQDLVLLTNLARDPGVRLITLTGVGGAGKTRLALELGSRNRDQFVDGVWFVPLGAITDPDLLASAIGAALSVNEAAGQSLAAFLSGKHLLLIIDNFEQLVAASAAITELLSGAPDIKIVVTSREALRLTGEHVFAVPSLNQVDCVELFVRRATAVRSTFKASTADTTAIQSICARLDGLPLAIELAAARVSLLSPEQILQRLSDRLKLLTGGARDMPLRHQTLRAALEWSYDLLTSTEQALFAKIAVFSGGFTLDAAEEVCGADLDVLASLVDKSLIKAGGERFDLLETVREYALERLEAREDGETVRAAHAAYFEALVERSYARRIDAEWEVSAWLEQEMGNLRAALDYIESVDVDRALAMAARLGWFWHVHSHLAEGRARLDRLLTRSTADGVRRAQALAAVGEIAVWQGDFATAGEALTAAAATFKERGLEQARALALYELGWGQFTAGLDEEARRTMDESLRTQRTIGDELLINRAQLGLLQMLVALGEVDEVERLAPESLSAARRMGDLRGEHFAYHFLADSALIRGDAETAQGRYRDALRAAIPLGDRIEIVFEVQGVAMSLAGRGSPEIAVRLAAAADAELATLGVDISAVAFWNELLVRYIGSAKGAMGQVRAAQADTAGRATAMSSAIEEALQS